MLKPLCSLGAAARSRRETRVPSRFDVNLSAAARRPPSTATPVALSR